MTVGLLAYVNDIVLIGVHRDRLKILFKRLHTTPLKVGLHVNEEKRNIMILSKRQLSFCQTIKIDRYEFERVKQFKYLGTILTDKNNPASEIAAKM